VGDSLTSKNISGLELILLLTASINRENDKKKSGCEFNFDFLQISVLLIIAVSTGIGK
jgi:hypothetical protein